MRKGQNKDMSVLDQKESLLTLLLVKDCCDTLELWPVGIPSVTGLRLEEPANLDCKEVGELPDGP